MIRKGQAASVVGEEHAAPNPTLPFQGASSGLARDVNREIVMGLLRRHQPIARVDLARLSGLQRSTVSLIIEDLKRENWVIEGDSVRTSRGRRPTLLHLNANVVLLVADIHPLHAVVALMDLQGHMLGRETVAVTDDPEFTTELIVEQMTRLRAAYPYRICEGVGIALPGRVSPETQKIMFAPNLHWGTFDLKSFIETRLDLQVEMDNAANACLLSEQWVGNLSGVANAALITVSEGIGGAILANGALVKGNLGLAGEFGHVSLDPNGPRCACGQDGCFEMFASARATLRAHTAAPGANPVRTFQELARLADSGDPGAVAVIDQQATYLALGLRVVTASISPEVVLFSGEIHMSWLRSAPVIERELKKRLLAGPVPRLIDLGDGEQSRLRGAAALVLQRHNGYQRAPNPHAISLAGTPVRLEGASL